MNARFIFNKRLRAVAMMHIPINDQHPLTRMILERVVGGNRHISEKTKPHRPIPQRMMPRRSHGGEAALRAPVEGHIHTIEHASRTRRRRIPRSLADDRVRIEPTAAGEHQILDARDVGPIVGKGEFVRHRVTTFVMHQRVEERRLVAQGTRNGTQSTDMFRVIPPGVVTTAVGVRNEGDGQELGTGDGEVGITVPREGVAVPIR